MSVFIVNSAMVEPTQRGHLAAFQTYVEYKGVNVQGADLVLKQYASSITKIE